MSVTDTVFAGARLFRAEVSFALLLHFLLQWCAQEAHSPGETSSTSAQGDSGWPSPTAQRVSLQEQGSAKPWLGGRYGCPGRTVCGLCAWAGTFKAALLSMLKTQREAGSCQHQRTVSKAANTGYSARHRLSKCPRGHRMLHCGSKGNARPGTAWSFTHPGPHSFRKDVKVLSFCLFSVKSISSPGN